MLVMASNIEPSGHWAEERKSHKDVIAERPGRAADYGYASSFTATLRRNWGKEHA
jgi:hypothetical protein